MLASQAAFRTETCLHVQTVFLWWDTLMRLGAVKTVREVMQLVELALHHSPLAAASADLDPLSKWLSTTRSWLHDAEAITMGEDLCKDKYLWLVTNRHGPAVSPIFWISL